MAESQVPYPYEQDDYDALTATLSAPRFDTYLKKAGYDNAFAMELYLYNARLAKAFLFPLSMAEITLRNAVDQALAEFTGTVDWHLNQNFKDNTLSAESKASLDKATARAGANADRNKIIAKLTFDFWSNLFRPEYGAIWRIKVNVAFPHLERGKSRGDIQKLVKTINRFRNRVAHYEPILDVNIPDVSAKIFELVSFRCKTTEKWVRAHATMNTTMRLKPSKTGMASLVLKSKLDENFRLVQTEETLFNALNVEDNKTKGFICVDNDGAILAAFSVDDITKLIAQKAVETGGLIDLNDHTIGDLCNLGILDNTWTSLPNDIAIGMAVTELRKPGIRVLVGISPTTGEPTGIILRAHRRY